MAKLSMPPPPFSSHDITIDAMLTPRKHSLLYRLGEQLKRDPDLEHLAAISFAHFIMGSLGIHNGNVRPMILRHQLPTTASLTTMKPELIHLLCFLDNLV